MEKSADAFRTISEAAEQLDLPQHVLRFWETRFSQIRPMKRAGGRRYYRPEDVELLSAIRHLLYGEGYTIRGVQRLLKQPQGVRSVVALVEQLRAGPLRGVAAAQIAAMGVFPEAAGPEAGGEQMPAEPEFEAFASAPVLAEFAPQLRQLAIEIAECRQVLAAARTPLHSTAQES